MRTVLPHAAAQKNMHATMADRALQVHWLQHVLQRTFTALFTAALEAAEANYSIFLYVSFMAAQRPKLYYSLFSKANFYGCAAAEVNYSIFSKRTFTAAQRPK